MSNYNMKQWIKSLKGTNAKKPIPVLSFPCVSLLGITVRELISDSELQAKGMRAVAERTDAAASVSFMDLSVEAECFGATVVVSDDEVPTVKGRIINDMDEAQALSVPAIGSGRLRARKQISQKHEVRQTKSHLGGVEQRRNAP